MTQGWCWSRTLRCSSSGSSTWWATSKRDPWTARWTGCATRNWWVNTNRYPHCRPCSFGISLILPLYQAMPFWNLWGFLWQFLHMWSKTQFIHTETISKWLLLGKLRHQQRTKPLPASMHCNWKKEKILLTKNCFGQSPGVICQSERIIHYAWVGPARLSCLTNLCCVNCPWGPCRDVNPSIFIQISTQNTAVPIFVPEMTWKSRCPLSI